MKYIFFALLISCSSHEIAQDGFIIRDASPATTASFRINDNGKIIQRIDTPYIEWAGDGGFDPPIYGDNGDLVIIGYDSSNYVDYQTTPTDLFINAFGSTPTFEFSDSVGTYYSGKTTLKVKEIKTYDGGLICLVDHGGGSCDLYDNSTDNNIPKSNSQISILRNTDKVQGTYAIMPLVIKQDTPIADLQFDEGKVIIKEKYYFERPNHAYEDSIANVLSNQIAAKADAIDGLIEQNKLLTKKVEDLQKTPSASLAPTIDSLKKQLAAKQDKMPPLVFDGFETETIKTKDKKLDSLYVIKNGDKQVTELQRLALKPKRLTYVYQTNKTPGRWVWNPALTTADKWRKAD